MFPIAGQTAGPIGLKFFVDTQGWPGGDRLKKIRNFVFCGQRRALQLVKDKIKFNSSSAFINFSATLPRM